MLSGSGSTLLTPSISMTRSSEAVAFYAYYGLGRSGRGTWSLSFVCGLEVGPGLLPLDTLALLEEERGVPVLVNRKSRLDWDGLRSKHSPPGDAQFELSRHRSDRDHFEHHGLHTVHRADL